MTNYQDMLCLSIRQPWAWLILHVGKDIENRSWHTNVRGRILIHSSGQCTKAEYQDAVTFAMDAIGDEYRGRGLVIPSWKTIERGGIIGSVEIVDCVKHSDSPWYMGGYGWVLRNPKPLPFDPCGGALQFWKRSQGKPPKEPAAPLFEGGVTC
jgi:hypothetical protein